MKLLVTGGYFDDSCECVIWLIDHSSERAEVVLRWLPPTHLRVPGKGFAGGSLGRDGMLYIAAHAAVVRVDPARGEVTGVLHQPCMNDLHHVAAIGDALWVTNTGLGAVDVFGMNGEFRASHGLLPAWANSRRLNGQPFDADNPPIRLGWSGASPTMREPPPEDDPYYSKDPRAQPFHQLKIRDYMHVNHVARVADRTLVTCFADGTVRDLLDTSVVCRVEGFHPHDGYVDGTSFWLTTTEGALVEFDVESMRELRRLDAFASGHFGWCRGFAAFAQFMAVGLTDVRHRPPRGWPRGPLDGNETSVLLLDKQDGRLVGRISLQDPVRHSKIYSVIRIPG